MSGTVALKSRKGGSHSPEQWLILVRNTQWLRKHQSIKYFLSIDGIAFGAGTSAHLVVTDLRLAALSCFSLQLACYYSCVSCAKQAILLSPPEVRVLSFEQTQIEKTYRLVRLFYLCLRTSLLIQFGVNRIAPKGAGFTPNCAPHQE